MTTTGKPSIHNAGATERGPVGGRPCVLVANDPAAYRDAIYRALRVMRPGLEVLSVPPRDLDREYARLQPALTICSRLTSVVKTGMSDWIELYPDGASVAHLSSRGERLTLPQPDFDLILSLVDRLPTRD